MAHPLPIFKLFSHLGKHLCILIYFSRLGIFSFLHSSASTKIPFANAADHLIFTSHQLFVPSTPDIHFSSSPRPRRRTASPASRTRASTPAGSATPRSFPARPRRILRPMLLEYGSRPLADKNKTAAQRVLWCPCSSPKHRNAQYAGYSSHLLLVSQHTIFQFNEFPIKNPLQHLPAWYSSQSSDLRRFHYAESGLVMI